MGHPCSQRHLYHSNLERRDWFYIRQAQAFGGTQSLYVVFVACAPYERDILGWDNRIQDAEISSTVQSACL